ncbi:NfeD family protein [Paraoerskovia marina]|uniref:NfeD family protein n=1 Tax=Paraoerskovia marina TaxID=545619 RepID=UPI00049224ED|nr:NfeD family protein [Paraoerskovia marina]
MAWLWWLGGAAVLALLEIVSLDLVLIMFAGGALAAAGTAGLGAPVWVQILAFLVTSGLLLFALRPWLLRSLRSRMTLTETNAAAQVGRMAVVLEDVTELHGRIKLAGEVWSARTEDEAPSLPVGTEVRVLRIDGATAVVGTSSSAPHGRAPSAM